MAREGHQVSTAFTVVISRGTELITVLHSISQMMFDLLRGNR